MKKIIVYGVTNITMRRNIEYFLDEGYEIIGYSDTYYTSDVIEGKNFISPVELCKYEFDYILVAAHSKDVQEEIRNSLMENTIPCEKIVVLSLLFQPSFGESFDLVGDFNNYYCARDEGLIFGLSYSLYGILKQKLNRPFYDCSVSNLDLYYNFKLYMYMKNSGRLSHIEKALLVFPYYYFNYDASLSPLWYHTWKMCCVWQLDDYHNYKQVVGGKDYVANYKMFGNKFSEFYQSNRFDRMRNKVYSGIDGEGNLDEKRFFDCWPETILENKLIFSSFIQELFQAGTQPIIIVPPIYGRGLNQSSKEAVEKKRQEFYEILKETEFITGKVTIFDYIDIFYDRRELFFDLSHLNVQGAQEFTRRINQEILEYE